MWLYGSLGNVIFSGLDFVLEEGVGEEKRIGMDDGGLVTFFIILEW